MNGQWLGNYKGTNAGDIMVNLDDMDDHYEGVAFLVDEIKTLPIVVAEVKMNDKGNKFRFITKNICTINPKNMMISRWDVVKDQYPNTNFPSEATVWGEWGENQLWMNWTTNIQTSGSSVAVLPKSRAGVPSEYKSTDVRDWDSYKKHVAKLEGGRYIFRGQKEPWRLRSFFHRTGRSDLVRFLNNDIQILLKQLSARTKHIFNLDIPNESGAFFSLVQHHGYPTPLLDWTYSPYVAAFFAYREITNKEALEKSNARMVRIFVFDLKEWKKDFPQPLFLNSPYPYLSFEEFMAINNERMVPQQAISSVTNIDDIEAYIKTSENLRNKRYLYTIDLPQSERKNIMNELRHIGITAGALFPGIDGACEALKERFFEI